MIYTPLADLTEHVLVHSLMCPSHQHILATEACDGASQDVISSFLIFAVDRELFFIACHQDQQQVISTLEAELLESPMKYEAIDPDHEDFIKLLELVNS